MYLRRIYGGVVFLFKLINNQTDSSHHRNNILLTDLLIKSRRYGSFQYNFFFQFFVRLPKITNKFQKHIISIEFILFLIKSVLKVTIFTNRYFTIFIST